MGPHWSRRRVKGRMAIAAVATRLAALPRALGYMPKHVSRYLAWRGDQPQLSPEALYDLIPAGVKTSAEDVLMFLSKRDLSHIKSKHLRPELAGDIKNVLFERWQWNRSRGSQHMRQWEMARLRLDNFAEGVVRAARSTGAAAARGALLGALVELPVTAAENIILFRGGGKTKREAWSDVGRDVGKSAAAGAAGTIVVMGIAMIGVPMAPAVVVPIAVAGGTLYTWSAARRIWEARARVALRPLQGQAPSPRTPRRVLHHGRRSPRASGLPRIRATPAVSAGRSRRCTWPKRPRMPGSFGSLTSRGDRGALPSRPDPLPTVGALRSGSPNHQRRVMLA